MGIVRFLYIKISIRQFIHNGGFGFKSAVMLW